jgi:DNA-binding transcriptional LysR family regulator
MRTDPYDAAFLIEQSIAPPLVARRLFTIEPFLYASPELLKRCQIPVDPQDLHNLPCIALERLGKHWVLIREGRQVMLEIQPAYTFSSVELCREFALAGLGITMLRRQLAADDEKTGKLVRVLPEWMGLKHDLKLVTAPGQLPGRVRLFVEHMLASYSFFKDAI